MNTQEWKQLISAYADGALSAGDAATAEKLLAERPECRAYLDELRRVSKSLEVLTDENLSPDAELKILSNIKKERSMRPYQWKATAAIAATVLVMVLAYNNYSGREGQVRLTGDQIVVPATVPSLETAPLPTAEARSPLAGGKRNIQGRLKSAADDIGDQYSTGGVLPSRTVDRIAAKKTHDAPAMAGSAVAPATDHYNRRSVSSNAVKSKSDAGALQYEPYYMTERSKGMSMEDKDSARNNVAVFSKAEYKTAAQSGYDRQGGYGVSAAAGSVGGGRQYAYPPTIHARVRTEGFQKTDNGFTTSYLSDEYGREAVNKPYEKELAPESRSYYPDRYLPYPQGVPSNTEEYQRMEDNIFLSAFDNPLSTFSADVDTASYTNIRRFLSQHQMPPQDSVRIEEMINYFSYDYPQPSFFQPFSITTDLAVCPWNQRHQLLRVGLKGKTPAEFTLPPSNLVFLIDVSGSMADANKLPLLKEGFKMMVQQLRPQDYVSIVVYSGYAGQVLAPTSGADKYNIMNAIDNLQAGGSTAGGEGIQLAYQLAKQSFIRGGNNRVILATDGDFNVGVSNTAELTRMIEQERRAGIFLTVLGFGQDNLKDGRMMQLADKGNGNYFYIDSLPEAQKVLVNELGSTLFTIAKDVKIQIEFNPAAVKAYRLIGYEKRTLAKEDFNNDRKDAGEIGAGHTVTALYEIVPAGFWSSFESTPGVDPLKYQKKPVTIFPQAHANEVVTVKLRYKDPNGNSSKLLSRTVKKSDFTRYPAGDFAWASAVAEFGLILRGSDGLGQASYDQVLNMARNNIGHDPDGLRAEFLTLVETARSLDPRPQPQPGWREEREYRNDYQDQSRGNINFK